LALAYFRFPRYDRPVPQQIGEIVGAEEIKRGSKVMLRSQVRCWQVSVPVSLAALMLAAAVISGAANGNVYDYTLNSIDGSPTPLSTYSGKVVLLVNVASRCGFTPQYSALEALYEKYKDQGFVILGFPANNFGSQEPGTDAEIKTFCSTKYQVTFPMFSKVSVKGDDTTPLYQFLTERANPSVAGEIKWNFTKFLVDRHGNVVARFEPPVKPDSLEVVSAIERLLKQ
jgi:glutathione peroxidase